MAYLIDKHTQLTISKQIDLAVTRVLSELPNHGSEEGLTPALGHALMSQSFETKALQVKFSYRQLNKQTEEPHAGADGGFLVSVTNEYGTVQKVALFQAKLLKGNSPVRQLGMRSQEAEKLRVQVEDMLKQTNEAVAMFYTPKEIYVVDAGDYSSRIALKARRPLSKEHRLLTLGTYLGRWIPRCTKGDKSSSLILRLKHQGGFRQGISMDVISKGPSIL